MLTSMNVTEFLNETASQSPAPGGGSISALAAALGSALTSMVCRLTIGKKKYANVQNEIEEVLKKSESIRFACTSLIGEDTEAFKKVMAAFSLPKESPEQTAQRTNAIQEATKTATLVPMKLMKLSAEAVLLTTIALEKGNRNSASDAGVALLMLKAAFEGAKLNVEVNLTGVQDKDFVAEIQKKVNALCLQMKNLER